MLAAYKSFGVTCRKAASCIALGVALVGCGRSTVEVTSPTGAPAAREVVALGRLEPAGGIISISALPGEKLLKFSDNVVEGATVPAGAGAVGASAVGAAGAEAAEFSTIGAVVTGSVTTVWVVVCVHPPAPRASAAMKKMLHRIAATGVTVVSPPWCCARVIKALTPAQVTLSNATLPPYYVEKAGPYRRSPPQREWLPKNRRKTPTP